MLTMNSYGVKKMNEYDHTSIEAKKVVSDIMHEKTFEIDQIANMQKKSGLIKAICMEVEKLSPPDMVKCIYKLESFGNVIIEDRSTGRLKYGGYYNSEDIVELFVKLLFVQDEDIGSKTAAILSTPGHFADTLIRDNNDKILRAAQMYPKTQDIIKLLGVTGTQTAKKMIESRIVNDSKDLVCAALAKLGDHKSQDDLIKQYKNAVPGKAKEKLALLLGYVASIKTILALAHDIRSEQTYIWHEPFALRSFRVDVIKGLHVAFPEEPLFWKPEYRPDDDSYYENIENWLKKNLNVTWSTSRPPFLYELDAPMLPNAGR